MRKLKFRQALIPIGLTGIGIAAMILGCTRQIYVPVEQVRVDTLLVSKAKADTLLGRDSVYLAVKGDTVVKEVYKWRFRSRHRVDTVYRNRIDTVTVTIPALPPAGETSSPKSFIALVADTMKSITHAGLLLLLIYVAVKFYRLFRSAHES